MEDDESVRSKGVEVGGTGGGRRKGPLWVSCSILEACIEGVVGQQGGKGEGEGGGVGGTLGGVGEHKMKYGSMGSKGVDKGWGGSRKGTSVSILQYYPGSMH